MSLVSSRSTLGRGGNLDSLEWLVQPWLRPNGELAVEQTERGIKVVVGPPGAPVAVAYRNSMFYLKIAETSNTQESLGFVSASFEPARITMKCDDIFDPMEGMQTWYGKIAAWCKTVGARNSGTKAEVAILQKDEAHWAQQYIQQCEGKGLK